MDTKITGGISPGSSFGSGASLPVPAKVSTDFRPQTQEVEISKTASDSARFEAVKQAAIQFSFPLGDKKFTIYKDQSGQYITIYTSLRDGQRTQIPEPEMLAMASGGRTGTLLQTLA